MTVYIFCCLGLIVPHVLLTVHPPTHRRVIHISVDFYGFSLLLVSLAFHNFCGLSLKFAAFIRFQHLPALLLEEALSYLLDCLGFISLEHTLNIFEKVDGHVIASVARIGFAPPSLFLCLAQLRL